MQSGPFSLNTCVKIQTLEHLGKGGEGVSIVIAIVTVVFFAGHTTNPWELIYDPVSFSEVFAKKR